MVRILGVALLLGGCSHGLQPGAVTNDEPDINVVPVKYKPDILIHCILGRAFHYYPSFEDQSCPVGKPLH